MAVCPGGVAGARGSTQSMTVSSQPAGCGSGADLPPTLLPGGLARRAVALGVRFPSGSPFQETLVPSRCAPQPCGPSSGWSRELAGPGRPIPTLVLLARDTCSRMTASVPRGNARGSGASLECWPRCYCWGDDPGVPAASVGGQGLLMVQGLSSGAGRSVLIRDPPRDKQNRAEPSQPHTPSDSSCFVVDGVWFKQREKLKGVDSCV